MVQSLGAILAPKLTYFICISKNPGICAFFCTDAPVKMEPFKGSTIMALLHHKCTQLKTYINFIYLNRNKFQPILFQNITLSRYFVCARPLQGTTGVSFKESKNERILFHLFRLACCPRQQSDMGCPASEDPSDLALHHELLCHQGRLLCEGQ